MTIHSDHPFLPPSGDRDPLRQLRGRMPAPVTVWASGVGSGRAGLTVSSVIVANGEPGHVLAVIDADSDWWTSGPETVAVNVLAEEHRFLADAFAGTVPAPGGPFTLGVWTDGEWGPVLEGSAGWLGIRLLEETRPVGWGLLVEGVVEHVETGDSDALIHLRGRYEI
ncbi:flavin reductase family protein [Aeromicrobium panaciterrae]|uniref:flavin reductase family protein n=1 Tax=Aeromicrobium panaciterrae TaxID=363861 RepID=UPI0031DB0AF3